MAPEPSQNVSYWKNAVQPICPLAARAQYMRKVELHLSRNSQGACS